jgi:hypothetical protein
MKVGGYLTGSLIQTSTAMAVTGFTTQPPTQSIVFLTP